MKTRAPIATTNQPYNVAGRDGVRLCSLTSGTSSISVSLQKHGSCLSKVKNRHSPDRGFHEKLVAGLDQTRHVALGEAVEQRQIAERRPLCDDRVNPVKQQSCRGEAH